jgi:hypothetical protein
VEAELAKSRDQEKRCWARYLSEQKLTSPRSTVVFSGYKKPITFVIIFSARAIRL